MNGMCNEQLIGTLTEAAVKQLAEKQHDILSSRSPSKLTWCHFRYYVAHSTLPLMFASIAYAGSKCHV